MDGYGGIESDERPGAPIPIETTTAVADRLRTGGRRAREGSLKSGSSDGSRNYPGCESLDLCQAVFEVRVLHQRLT